MPRTLISLAEASEITGDTKTGCINRAVQVYAWLLARLAAGDHIHAVDKEGATREIQIF